MAVFIYVVDEGRVVELNLPRAAQDVRAEAQTQLPGFQLEAAKGAGYDLIARRA